MPINASFSTHAISCIYSEHSRGCVLYRYVTDVFSLDFSRIHSVMPSFLLTRLHTRPTLQILAVLRENNSMFGTLGKAGVLWTFKGFENVA